MSALLLYRLKKQQQRAWEVSRKQLLGAFSGGGIHHLCRPGAKALPERCWSELMVGPPERCPVCVRLPMPSAAYVIQSKVSHE